MSYRSLLPNGRAQNNFQRVARHNDQPKKFLLGLALFLTGQKIGKILINPCVIFCWWGCCIFTNWEKQRFTDEGLAVYSTIRVAWLVNMTSGWNFWLVKTPFWPDIVCWWATILNPAMVISLYSSKADGSPGLSLKFQVVGESNSWGFCLVLFFFYFPTKLGGLCS